MNITKTEVEAAKLAFEQAHEAYMQTPVWAPNARKVKDTMLAKRHDYEDKLKQLALAVGTSRSEPFAAK